MTCEFPAMVEPLEAAVLGQPTMTSLVLID